MLKEIAEFIDKNSWFDIENLDEDELLASTRDSGNVGGEECGMKDISEGYRVINLVKEKFGVQGELEEVDEWVHLNFEID